MDNESAVIGTMEVVAAAAAPIAPWGTVASVVIMAGISVYETMSAAEKTEQLIKNKYDQVTNKLEFAKTLQDTVERAKNRPVMPLDLYSGPPMYWILTQQELSKSGTQYYKIPNGEVDWPCGVLGGKTAMPKTNNQNINVGDVFAPFPPTISNAPVICIFFWAVPIFFARFQQLLGEDLIKVGYDPEGFDLSKTESNNKVLSGITKNILKEGFLDGAGNWYAKIGAIIPPIAINDDDFAPRYYGRSLWVHNLAIQNIKFLNGDKISSSGINNSTDTATFNSQDAKTARSISDFYSIARPRFVLVNGTPYYQSSDRNKSQTTPVMNSGEVLDIQGLVSRFDKSDGLFQLIRQNLLSGQKNDDSLFFAVSIPSSSIVTVNTEKNSAGFPYIFKSIGQSLLLNGTPGEGLSYKIGTYDLFKSGIKFAGGFQPASLSPFAKLQSVDQKTTQQLSQQNQPWNWSYLNSRFNGAFSLAPYKIYVTAKLEQVGDGRAPRPHIGPPWVTVYSGSEYNHTTYGFMDFDPDKFQYSRIPGLWDGNDSGTSKYNWIRNLAIMPGFEIDLNQKTKPEDYGFSAISKSVYNNFDWAGSYTYAGNESDGAKAESFVYDTFQVSKTYTSINEIVKLRPPLAGEPTIKLSSKFWGEGAPWAKLKNSEVVDFALIKSNIVVFQFNRSQLNGTGISEKPLTSAYVRTNTEENKPIIEIPGMANPSPFYCGRRADARTKSVWKEIRLASTTEKNQSDSGWEDCHEWSWPYSTTTLAEIGRISRNIYNKLGEGIGRAGLSPSSIATGPTIWGDVSLYTSRYTSMLGGSSDPNSPLFGKFKAKAMWQAIIEMQTGAYSRYPMIKNNINDTFADSVKSTFAAYGSDEASRKTWKNLAEQAIINGNPPKIWDENLKKYVIIDSADKAADLCVQIVNSWFNGTFPKPTVQFQNSLKKKTWDAKVLEEIADAHIRLKNWAIDLGKPEFERVGAQFPNDKFSINFFGLNKANRIAIESLNSITKSNAVSTNPIQTGINKIIDSQKDISTALPRDRKNPVIFGSKSIAALTASAIILTAIGMRKK